MPSKAELDTAFLSRHDLLTQKFYQAKRAGLITPTLQALFDKTHGYLTHIHLRACIMDGYEQDYFVDEVRDDDGNIIIPGTKLFSVVLSEDLLGRFKLSNAERAQVRNRWGVVL